MYQNIYLINSYFFIIYLKLTPLISLKLYLSKKRFFFNFLLQIFINEVLYLPRCDSPLMLLLFFLYSFLFLVCVTWTLAIDNIAFDTLKSITASDRKVVTYNEDKHDDGCTPNNICKGAKLTDIPGFASKITTGLLKNIETFDSKKIRSCFRNKYILFLGDHSLRETVHDIVTVLTGINHNISAYKEYRTRFSKHKELYSNAATQNQKVLDTSATTDVSSNLSSYIVHGAADGYPSMEIHQHGAHMTLSTLPDDNSGSGSSNHNNNNRLNSDLNITFGFLNHGALRSSEDRDRLCDNLRNRDASLCLIKSNASDMCRQPDKLIMQLSSHNGEKELWQNVVSYLPPIMTLLREHRDTGVDVFFKGTVEQGLHKSRMEYINLVATYHALNKDIGYIDVPAVTSLFNRHFNISFDTSNSISANNGLSSNIRLKARTSSSSGTFDGTTSRTSTGTGVLRHYKKDAVTYTNWVTQYVLNYLCVPNRPRCATGSCRKISS